MKTCYLFHGDDSYSSFQKVHRWQQAFEEKFGDMNVEIFEGKDLSAAQFSEAISTLPFLSDKKMVIIRNFFKDAPADELKAAADHLEKIDENCIVIFLERQKADARTALFKRIKKSGNVEEFPLMERYELAQWIATEVKKNNITALSSKVINQLAETVGPDLWHMHQEIEKLGLYAQSGNPITEETIDSLVSPNPETTIFKLTDYLATKQAERSIKTLQTLLDKGENIIQVLFMIIRHFRILIQIQDCLANNVDRKEIARKIKQHPFAVQNGIKQVQNFSAETLANIYEQLLKIDIAMKSGKIKMSTTDQTELQLTLERFILELCH
ncbi:MAG: DNA polymerase III subunit delta [Candidatus Gracilibacteria bacterium]